MVQHKQAFTLIELLVVVLIIGILAAVAVPQYQRAVQKSRMAQIIPLLKAVGQAEQAYYLANGEYTNNETALDIEKISLDTNNWKSVWLDTRNGVVQVQASAKFLPDFVVLLYELPSGVLYCSQGYTARQQKICQKFYGDKGMIPDPTNSAYEMFPIVQ